MAKRKDISDIEPEFIVEAVFADPTFDDYDACKWVRCVRTNRRATLPRMTWTSRIWLVCFSKSTTRKKERVHKSIDDLQRCGQGQICVYWDSLCCSHRAGVHIKRRVSSCRFGAPGCAFQKLIYAIVCKFHLCVCVSEHACEHLLCVCVMMCLHIPSGHVLYLRVVPWMYACRPACVNPCLCMHSVSGVSLSVGISQRVSSPRCHNMMINGPCTTETTTIPHSNIFP